MCREALFLDDGNEAPGNKAQFPRGGERVVFLKRRLSSNGEMR